MNEDGSDQTNERGGDQGEQEQERGFDDGALFLRLRGLSDRVGDGFGDFPEDEKRNQERGDRQPVGDPGDRFSRPFDGQGGGGLPAAEADPRAEAEGHGADEHPCHSPQQHESGAHREDDERGGAEADLWDGVGRQREEPESRWLRAKSVDLERR